VRCGEGLLDLVTLEPGLFSKRAVGSDFEIIVQIIEQSLIILELDVNVGED
jgi:hypothetical protein